LIFSDVSGPTACPEASVTSYQSTMRNIPEEERRPELGNLKYREKNSCLKFHTDRPGTESVSLRQILKYLTP